MDVKLESLIEKIKKDGIDKAKQASGDIVEKAKAEAKAILKDAKAKAQKIEEEAKARAVKLETNSKNSLKQAGRDLTLTVKSELISLFDRILKDKAGEALTPEFMKELIAKIVDKWGAKKDIDWEVLVSKADKEKMTKLLQASFKKEVGKTIEVKTSRSIDKGFRIGIKGENFHHDFTDQSILEALGEFLNPSLSAILNANNG